MDAPTTKIELVKLILNIENEEFIDKIIQFVKREKSDFWNDLSTEEQKEILLGLDQLEQGKRISFSDALKKIS